MTYKILEESKDHILVERTLLPNRIYYFIACKYCGASVCGSSYIGWDNSIFDTFPVIDKHCTTCEKKYTIVPRKLKEKIKLFELLSKI